MRKSQLSIWRKTHIGVTCIICQDWVIEMARYIKRTRSQASRIKRKIRPENVEKAITRDKYFLFTMFSYATVFLIFINISVVHSSVMGIAASSVYFLVNAIFLGSIFFRKEDLILRLILGNLLLIVFLGLISRVVMMVYNLDAVRSTIVLSTAATLCSFTSKMAKYSISIEFSRNNSNLKH